jgi:uncharacterized protein (DUF1501 family)
LALARPGTPRGALDLDGFFGLHPALTGLHERYRTGELLVAHAVATPYRERSHFDGQNVLENGGERPSGLGSGWLNRALAARSDGAHEGLAIGQTVPLILRGTLPVASWAPSVMPDVEPDLLARLRDLYAGDATLAARLDAAMEIDAIAGEEGKGVAGRRGRNGGAARFIAVARSAGHLLAQEQGPRVAVLDSGGWDTHAQEGGADGQLSSRLKGLDEALGALRTGLGDAWKSTVALICTEFGRTVAINGTRGTDHGTAAAAFLLGGAVRGGRVLADWPGLASRHRHEGRDLAPTLDLRALAKGVLSEHLELATGALDTVFPSSGRVAPVRGVVA